MSLTTSLTELTTTIGTISSCGNTGNQGISFNSDGTLGTVITSSITTATIVGEDLINQHYLRQIYQRSQTAYIDSMSDEELVNALEQANLLEKKVNKGSKTL